MEEEKKNIVEDIDALVIDSILEKPITFELDGRFFYIYPPSYGVSLLATDVAKDIDVNKELFEKLGAEIALITSCSKCKDKYIRYISLHSFKRRIDALDEVKIMKRIEELNSLSISEIIGLYTTIAGWYDLQSKYMKHFGLDKESEKRKRISELKKNDSSYIVFGGRSVYGSLIDMACERYKWSLQYVLWGISLTNLNMMLADSINSVYVSKEDRKKYNISTDNTIIKSGDKEALLRFVKQGK